MPTATAGASATAPGSTARTQAAPWWPRPTGRHTRFARRTSYRGGSGTPGKAKNDRRAARNDRERQDQLQGGDPRRADRRRRLAGGHDGGGRDRRYRRSRTGRASGGAGPPAAAARVPHAERAPRP